nr:diacylglycerol/polyprenol kinase family protein [Petrachloros mirabilis]
MPDLATPFGTLSLPLQLSVVGAWLGLVVVVAEGLKRWQPEITEAPRKVVHIGVGNVILLAWWFQMPAALGIGASVLFSILTLVSYRYPILASVSEVGRQSLGTFFYAVSIGVLIAIFWLLGLPQYAVIGILVMTWGDGLAALVGQTWGRHPFYVWGMTKSWEGSLAMAVVSFLVIAGVLLAVQGWQGSVIGVAIATALTATALESFSKLGIDNLTVPLGSAATCYLLNELWF